MTDVEIKVEGDAARTAGELLAGAAARGGHVALSGGGSVGEAHVHAAALTPDWSAAEVWWGDDRAVGPDDERSNYLLARATLLARLAVGPAAVHRVEGELGALVAARRYDDALAGVRLTLALNGIGPDGHTASLFPEAPGLHETERRAVAADAGLEPLVPRVTLTPPVFGATEVLVYLVTGVEKAEAVRRAFAEPPSTQTPASLIRGRRTVAILDAAAASLLP